MIVINRYLSFASLAICLSLGFSIFCIDSPMAHAQTSPCQNQFSSTTAVPEGYGAAYNLFSTAKELLVQGTDCAASSVSVKAGNGDASQYVYKQGYSWDGTKWNTLNLTSTSQLVADAWYVGSATGSVSLTPGIFVAYVCQQQSGAWKCGCSDTACSTPRWQVQAVKTGASGGGGNTGGQGSGQLNIPPREQWMNSHGYCGETSVQSAGLYYGAWVSQQVVRDLAGGELLLGVNETKALDKLHFSYVKWSGGGSGSYNQFVLWIKDNLIKGFPPIIAVYLSGMSDADYDHIIPVAGIKFTSPQSYDAADTLMVNTLMGNQVEKKAGEYSASRSSCSSGMAQGGCVPTGTDYGVAITGIADQQGVTLPVTLSVPVNSEPNVSQNEQASQLTGTVTVTKLTSGQNYSLLRYDDYTKVPVSGPASGFLSSGFTQKYDFTATGTSYTFTDPNTFSSSGTTYYRCVPR